MPAQCGRGRMHVQLMATPVCGVFKYPAFPDMKVRQPEMAFRLLRRGSSPRLHDIRRRWRERLHDGLRQRNGTLRRCDWHRRLDDGCRGDWCRFHHQWNGPHRRKGRTVFRDRRERWRDVAARGRLGKEPRPAARSDAVFPRRSLRYFSTQRTRTLHSRQCCRDLQRRAAMSAGKPKAVSRRGGRWLRMVGHEMVRNRGGAGEERRDDGGMLSPRKLENGRGSGACRTGRPRCRAEVGAAAGVIWISIVPRLPPRALPALAGRV